ncbi:MAG: HU family DNA-binding protein [Bacteroidetes bacterium]|nr:HU family DNA-binding protein [Bacteroidota bacterium]
MSFNFHSVYRIDPRKPAEKGKHYPAPEYHRTVNQRELAKEIAQRSSLSSTDVLAVIESLKDVMPYFLTDGYIVDLEGFGTFRLLLKGNGRDEGDQVSAKDIKEVKLNFLPGNEIKENLRNIDFSRSKKKNKRT